MRIIDEIANIHYSGLTEEFNAIGITTRINYNHLRKMWGQRIREGNKVVLTERNKKGKTIGFLAIFDDNPMVYVDNSYQRRGIGKRLLELSKVDTVWVMLGNDKAQEFYRSQGFEPTKSREVVKLGHNITELKWVKGATK